MREAVVKFLSARGCLAQPDALEYLIGLADPVGALKRSVADGGELPLVLTAEHARRLAPGAATPTTVARGVTRPDRPVARGTPPPPESPAGAALAGRGLDIQDPGLIRASRTPESSAGAAPARAVPPPSVVRVAAPVWGQSAVVAPPGAAPQPHILADVTGESTCEGSIEDFARLFRDRFGRLRKLYRKRREMVGATTIDKIGRSGVQVKFLAIVNEVRATKNGHRLLEVEDETGSQAVLVPKTDARLIEIASGVMRDEVVGIVGRPSNRGGGDGLFILDELVRPELPLEPPRHWGHPGGAVFVSDVHVGSDTFLGEPWEAFIDWLAGRRSEGRDLAAGVRWLVINGDLVDGVGIYPGQEQHLAIPDVMDQYQEAARMLRRVPEHIRVIISPGNHDAVRPAEPQPAFPASIKALFGPNVTCVGNPCSMALDGVEVLAYHGVSLFDFFEALPSVNINKPLETMKEMLLRRHLCPVYGGKTPLAPEHRDYMVIENIPDVFVTGHVHAADVAEYRGVTLINSSAWQAQTDYQKMLGFVPDPCKAFHVDLATGASTVIDFVDAPEAGDPAVAKKQMRRLAA